MSKLKVGFNYSIIEVQLFNYSPNEGATKTLTSRRLAK